MNKHPVRMVTAQITGWDDFHETSKALFGFPDFYGRNMDAWIDCMSSLDEEGMTGCLLSDGGELRVEVIETEEFSRRLPEIFGAFIECTALVNRRYLDSGRSIRVALVLL